MKVQNGHEKEREAKIQAKIRAPSSYSKHGALFFHGKYGTKFKVNRSEKRQRTSEAQLIIIIIKGRNKNKYL